MFDEVNDGGIIRRWTGHTERAAIIAALRAAGEN
jgi:hypothetical protein